jgi:hypothetical protein
MFFKRISASYFYFCLVSKKRDRMSESSETARLITFRLDFKLDIKRKKRECFFLHKKNGRKEREREREREGAQARFR